MTTKIDIGISDKDREAIANGLSKLLADTYTLYLTTHNFHWNVTGPMFNTLHTMFMGQYTELWNAVDPIAERISSSDQADYIVELLVDVYGTVRNQTDWLLRNQEKLSAVTSFEVTITPVQNPKGISQSKRIGVEAEYIENYNFWVGPVEKNIKVKPFEYNQLLGTMGTPEKLNKEPAIEGTYIKPQSPSTVITPNSNGSDGFRQLLRYYN